MQTTNEQASLEALLSWLDEQKEQFVPEIGMLTRPLKGVGYHTTLADGTMVCSTRENAEYAVLLLKADRVAEAEAILRKVLALQDREPDHKTYGIWPWFKEETLEQMSPPDWNWAAFIGAQLVVAHRLYAEKMSVDLVQDIELALKCASEAIIRRNVTLSYTNIAIMEAVVTATSGEVLEDNTFRLHGQERLKSLVGFTQEQGSFCEFNSLTYTLVALLELERALHLLHDEATLEAVQWLWTHAWDVISSHFHPKTREWAGPHSRAYSDFLSDYQRHILNLRCGQTVCRPAEKTFMSVLDPIQCPEAFLPRFTTSERAVTCVKQRFSNQHDQPVTGTTWMHPGGCLGSVNTSTFWTQARPVIGYLDLGTGQPGLIRLRFYHDGKDFASAVVTSEQEEACVRSCITMRDGHGDYHIHLDRPADGQFQAESFAVRYELTAPEAEVRQITDQTFELTAGKWKAVVTIQHGAYMGNPISWRSGKEGQTAYVEGVMYEGKRTAFSFPDLASLDLQLTLQLDCLPES